MSRRHRPASPIAAVLLLCVAVTACSSDADRETHDKAPASGRVGVDPGVGVDILTHSDVITVVPDCQVDGDCIDQLAGITACRPGRCYLGVCELGLADEGAGCSDGEPCTTPDHCAGGVCLPGQWTDCEDHNPCTDDSCDPAGGCLNLANLAACSISGGCAVGVCHAGQCQAEVRLFEVVQGAEMPRTVTAAVALDDGGLLVVANLDLPGAVTGAQWLRLDGGGAIQSHGGLPLDRAMAAAAMPGGGAVVVGAFRSADGTLQARAVGLAQAATIAWMRDYGGAADDTLRAVAPMPAGGWVGAGTTHSKGGGGGDIWLLRMDPTGFPLLDYSFGSSDVEVATAVTATQAGGSAIAGTQTGKSGNVDAVVMVAATDAALVWVAQFGGPHAERPAGLIQRADGTFLMAGTRGLAGGKHAFWLAALALDGSKLWSRFHTLAGDGRVASLVPMGDGGGLIVGGDRGGPQLPWRPRVLRVDAMGNSAWTRTWDWQGGSVLAGGDRLTNGDLLLAGNLALVAGSTVVVLRTDPWGHASCADAGGCADLGAADCDDGVACSTDLCDPAVGCEHAWLADGEPCAVGMSCAVSKCVP